jgi:hypothetical protein
MTIAIGRKRGAEVPARSAADRTGLRRVDWVRLVDEGRRYRAEVVGVGFRLPVTRAIPLTLAADLIFSGVPHVTRTDEYTGAGA